MSKSEQKKKFSVFDHVLVPKHEIVPDPEVEKILAELKVSRDKLPRMLPTDAAAKEIGAKKGDVVRIYRKGPGGETVYYRVVG